jgi:hypothetical protein
VLLLAARGPDGVGKDHLCKTVVAAYRGTVFLAGRYGRLLNWGEKADSFMSLDVIADAARWAEAIRTWFSVADSLPHHYLLHFAHGAQIIGYKHPDDRFKARWIEFYLRTCEDMHMHPETEAQMDKRLGDWARKEW